MSTSDPTITQLQTQQALFTQALRAMLQGSWAGGPETVEAFLYALDPTLTGTLAYLDVPVTHSEAEDHPKA